MTPEEIEAELDAREDRNPEKFSVERLYEDALESIQRLLARIHHGDSLAVHALVEISEQIVLSLDYARKQTHKALPVFQAVSNAAAESYLWPAMIPAMEEMRTQAALESTPENLGENLPVRAEKRKGKGKTRVFINTAQTGFAFNVFHVLDARRDKLGLPDFTVETLPAWISAGVKFALARPDLFPDSVEIKSAIDKRRESQGQAEEPARRHVFEKHLKAGFPQLVKS